MYYGSRCLFLHATHRCRVCRKFICNFCCVNVDGEPHICPPCVEQSESAAMTAAASVLDEEHEDVVTMNTSND
jgi:hypothetical protein